MVLACFRRWRIAAFLIAAITVEAATYRVDDGVVHRDRPQVHPARGPAGERELSRPATPPPLSPSTAGSRWCSRRAFRSTWFRAVCWASPWRYRLFVALARMYRGMHHPLDALAGVAIGVAALLVALFAARAAGFAARERDADRIRSGT